MDIKVSAENTIRDLQRVESEILAAARQTLGQAAAFIAETARGSNAWHDRTGNLRRSIHRETTGDYEQRVTAGGREAPEAIFIEDGTRAHEIRPKRVSTVSSRRSSSKSLPPVLRFQIAGHWVSASVVHHPGTTATHFMQDARDKGEEVLVRFLEQGLTSIGA